MRSSMRGLGQNAGDARGFYFQAPRAAHAAGAQFVPVEVERVGGSLLSCPTTDRSSDCSACNLYKVREPVAKQDGSEALARVEQYSCQPAAVGHAL